MELVFRDYWWPQPWKYVKEFVEFCNVCVRAKNLCHRPYGLLQPLPIPTSLWFSISRDFITNLPPSSFYDSILVVVDRLTKMVHFIPCIKTIIGKGIAKLFLDHVFQYHGLLDIISNHGPQFASKFSKQLFELLGVNVKLSSIFHPHMDGQTEWVNQVLE
jgi:hypothetical protein